MKPLHVVQDRYVQWATLSVLIGLLPVAYAGPAASKTVTTHTVLVMGDSLSAAHGLAESQGWVALIAARIAASKPGWRVVNASISGETSAGGAARVMRALTINQPAVVVIELGANDALRGLPLQQMRSNLARMMSAARGGHAKILLIGMRMPPNYGPVYTRDFEQSYRDLARQFDASLLPFLLEPIALDRTAFQSDGMHPVASAEPKLRDHVWRTLEPLLK